MADIVLKDRDGNDVTHEGAQSVRLNTVGGGTQRFVAAEAVEKTVDLDFSSGDMIVTPDPGTLFKKVNIPTPETLIPDNIKKDVEIAGIVGTMEAGGGGGNSAYIEYALNDSGEPISAKMYNFTTIPRGCFAYMNKLQSVDLSESPNITSIGDYAFFNCTALTSLTIPDGVTSIGSSAFRACTTLSSVNIGSGLTSIPYYAFAECTKLISIVIPDTVITIKNYVFSGCTALTSVTIGSSVNRIGQYAFQNCSVLTEAIFKDTTTWYYGNSEGQKSVEFPTNSLTYKGNAAGYLNGTYVSKYWMKE